jgi:hypothetical protein
MTRKLILVILIALFALFVLFVYVIIPQKIKIEREIAVRCTNPAAKRMVLDPGQWRRWWPGEVPGLQTIYVDSNYQFNPDTISFDEISVEISNNSFLTQAELQVLPVNRDSVILQWDCAAIKTSMNPLSRIKNFNRSKELGSELNSILVKMRTWLENETNVYGIAVKKTKVKDSTLIATRFETSSYPSVNEIYAAVDKLKKYIADQHATENNFPMMHVDEGYGGYQTMIAIPVNRELPGTKEFMQKRMVLGNILEAEVHGGDSTVERGLRQLDQYRVDHEKASPAIPFALLVTDRSKQPDTLQWVTKLYFPVF